jgi:hypothetical protein
MRYFYVRIDAGFSNSIYSIYSTLPPAGNLALLFDPIGSTLVATGLTYTQLTTGDGVLVEVPGDTQRIYLYDADGNFCSVGIEDDIRINSLPVPTPTPTPTPTGTPTSTSTLDCYFDVDLNTFRITPTPTNTPTPTSTSTLDCSFDVDLDTVYPTPTPTSTPTSTSTLDCSFDVDLETAIYTPTPTNTPTSTPTGTPTGPDDLCFEFELTEIVYDRTLTFKNYQQGLFTFELSEPINYDLYINLASINAFDVQDCYGNQYYSIDQIAGNTLVECLKINAGSTIGTKMGISPLTGSTLYYKFTNQISVVNTDLASNTYLLDNETFTYNGLVIKAIIDNDCKSYNIITPTETPTPTNTPTPPF